MKEKVAIVLGCLLAAIAGIVSWLIDTFIWLLGIFIVLLIVGAILRGCK